MTFSPDFVLKVVPSRTFETKIFKGRIEYEIFGEGSHISTNQKRENSAFSPLIG